MVHRTQTINGIWTQESVYRDSPLGNLDRNIWIRGMSFPLQEGFDSDSKACLPVGIDDLTTFTFEQRIVGAMPVPNSTAVGTPFRGMPTIHDVQSDIVVEASLLKNLPEFIKRNAHNSPVELFTFGFESPKFLDRDVGIEPVCNPDYFPDNLSKICFDKVTFIVPNPFELTNGVQGLKHRPSFHNLLSSDPDTLSKIGLIKDFALCADDGNGEMLGIDINSQDVLPLWDFLLFGKVCYNLQVGGQTECLTSPTIANKTLKSLIVSILFDWDGNSIPWISSKFNEEIGLRAEGLAVARDVEFDGQPINIVGFLSPRITNQTASDLNVKRGVLLAN